MKAQQTVERLKEVKRVFLGIDPARLDMGVWTGFHAECGTVHCLGGWMRLDEWFQKNTEIGEIFAVHPISGFDGMEVGPSYWEEDRSTVVALSELIGVERVEAALVFGFAAKSPKTGEAVGSTLARLIKKYRKLAASERFEADLEAGRRLIKAWEKEDEEGAPEPDPSDPE